MKIHTQCVIVSCLLASVALSSCTTSKVSAPRGLFSGSSSSASTPYISALQGGIISRSGVDISDSDRQRALEAEYRALEAAPGGQPVTWSGRGVSGKVVAAAPYQVGSQNCRQYTHTVTANGKD